MATSLIGGLLSANFIPGQIFVAEPDAQKCLQLEQQYGISTSTDNLQATQHDVIILAVKPQALQQVCRELSSACKNTASLFVSIAAGVRSNDINRWLGDSKAIVRCMPNTPALVATGATALYANTQVSDNQKQLAQTILESVGFACWVNDEQLLDAVTAVSGSGPAYFFLLMDAMQQAGEELGLDADTSRQLTLQTALGAARMALESAYDVATLRAAVTSKGGTTEQAIASFEQAGFRDIVKQALQAAHQRSQTLADELAKDES